MTGNRNGRLASLRVCEVYPSVQGEGPRVGAPTTFLRFGGCNLRCALWPCDSPYAIFPELSKEWKPTAPGALAEQLTLLSPKNICLTGGEPFLQNHKSLRHMIDTVEAEGAYRFEAFTNGTVEYPDWAFDQVNLVVDWKLPGSGECFPDGKMKRPQLEHARWQNLHRMMNSGMHALKYTVASEADFTVAFRHFYETKGLSDAPLEVFIGIVWDKEITNEELVELMLQYEVPWRLNVQVHNHVWDRSQRGI